MASHLPNRTPLIQEPCVMQCQRWSLSASCPSTDHTRTFCCKPGSLEVNGAQPQLLCHALAIIKQACREYAKLSSDIIDPWIEHCGRNVSHHMGPLPLCRRLHVVVSCSANHPEAMYMGKDAKPMRLTSTFQETAMQATSCNSSHFL